MRSEKADADSGTRAEKRAEAVGQLLAGASHDTAVASAVTAALGLNTSTGPGRCRERMPTQEGWNLAFLLLDNAIPRLQSELDLLGLTRHGPFEIVRPLTRDDPLALHGLPLLGAVARDHVQWVFVHRRAAAQTGNRPDPDFSR